MAAIFGESKIFWKLPIVHWLDTLWVENFYETRWLPKVAKTEMFQIHIEYSSTTIWVKKSVEIAYGFRDINIFGFSAKIQDGRQKWRKNWNFSILYRILCYHPTGQKFC